MDKLSVFDNYKKTIEEIKQQNGGKVLDDASWEVIAKSMEIEPCKIHKKKKGKNCRVCKNVQAMIDDFISYDPVAHKDNNNTGNGVYEEDLLRNFNSTLKDNIIESKYYREVLTRKNTFKELIREVKDSFDSFDPWTSFRHGKASFFWSGIFRALELKISIETIQKECLDGGRSLVFVFCLLYIRFAVKDDILLKSYIPLMKIKKELKIDRNRVTVGEFIEDLLKGYKFKGIILPPIRLALARKINMYYLDLEEKRLIR